MHRQLLIKKILRYTRNLLILFFTSTLLTVIIYRFMPVYITPLMVIRSVQQIISGDKPTWKHTWVSFDKISPSLPMAVIASEDNRFAEHNGFDFVEIKKAMKENETRKRKRGASTISQQTAKNVFLWPQSSWVRKGLEVYFTFLIELFWPKERIMEVYLNSIEMGKGIYLWFRRLFPICVIVCVDTTYDSFCDWVVDFIWPVVSGCPYPLERGDDNLIDLYGRSIQYRVSEKWRIRPSLSLRTGAMS